MKKKNKIHVTAQLNNNDISYSKNVFQRLHLENTGPKS